MNKNTCDSVEGFAAMHKHVANDKGLIIYVHLISISVAGQFSLIISPAAVLA